MSSADDDLRARIETFTADVTILIRRRALEAVNAALDGVHPAAAAPVAPAPAKAHTQAPRTSIARKAAPAALPARPAAPRLAARKRFPGKKRPPGEIKALVDKVASYIQGHPGATMEAIRDALDTPSTELAVPTKKLIVAGKIRAQGKKQLTRYFPM